MISSVDINDVLTVCADIPVNALIVREESDFNSKLFATFTEFTTVARSVIIRPLEENPSPFN